MHFIRGKRIFLRPMLESDVTLTYVQWLNDPEVNQYSRRRFFPTSEIDIRSYLQHRRPDEHILAICSNRGKRHIGNIKFGPIDWPNQCANISIIVGNKRDWGRGYATEAIYLLTKHLLWELGLNRVGADSCNPGFLRVMEKLGWSLDGRLRERFKAGGQFLDHCQFSILKKEFTVRREFERSD